MTPVTITHQGITITRRANWQPCGVCGVNTSLYVRFIAQDGKLTVWPICSVECYQQRNRAYQDIINNRQGCLAFGIC